MTARARLPDVLVRAGPGALSDLHLVEVLLGRVLPASRAAAAARDLVNRFGSLAGVIAASREELAEAPGLGREEIAILRLVHECAQRFLRDELHHAPVLANWTRLLQYLQLTVGRSPREEVRVLYLDPRNRLIQDEPQGRGTVNQAPLYPREVVRRALELNATALMLVHNHPSGDPRPSEQDLQVTERLRAAAALFDITLHDHIVVARGRHFSLRENLLLR